MVCEKGHLACRECVFEHILARKKEIEEDRLSLQLEKDVKDAKNATRDAEKHAQLLKTFEEKEIKVAKSSAGVGKDKVTNFWIPSAQPDAVIEEKEHVMDVLCMAEPPGHLLSLKKLVVVHWKVVEQEGDEPSIYCCPSCDKQFTQGSKLILLNKCGHVFCLECRRFLIGEKAKCTICNAKVKNIVELRSTEGTGFSEGGKTETIKRTIAFQ